MGIYTLLDTIKLLFLLLIPTILITIYGGIATLIFWFIIKGGGG